MVAQVVLVEEEEEEENVGYIGEAARALHLQNYNAPVASSHGVVE